MLRRHPTRSHAPKTPPHPGSFREPRLNRAATGQARVLWATHWEGTGKRKTACATVSAPLSGCPASATARRKSVPTAAGSARTAPRLDPLCYNKLPRVSHSLYDPRRGLEARVRRQLGRSGSFSASRRSLSIARPGSSKRGTKAKDSRSSSTAVDAEPRRLHGVGSTAWQSAPSVLR